MSAADDVRTIVEELSCHGTLCPQCVVAEQQGYGRVHCPANPDPMPSLSVTIGPSDAVLVECSQDGASFNPLLASVLQRSGLRPVSTTRRTHYYNYTDRRGDLIYQAVVEEEQDKETRFSFREPNGTRAWRPYHGQGQLYRQHTLITLNHEPTVFVVGSEKDADRLVSLGLVATTTPVGAWGENHAQSFWDRNVVVLPSNNDAGHNYGTAVWHSLRGKTRSVVYVPLPGLPDGGGVSDWLDLDHGFDELIRLIRAADPSAAGAEKGRGIIGIIGINGNQWAESSNDSKYTTRRGSMIPTSTVSWLWRQRVPFGAVTALEGDTVPSLLALDLVARLTTGRAMPDDTEVEGVVGAVDCLIVPAVEDSPETTIMPRLLAAGADPDHYHLLDKVEVKGEVEQVEPELPRDVGVLRQVIKELDIRLVVIGQDARRAIRQLTRLAREENVAVVVLSDLTRGGSAASSVLLAGLDPHQPEDGTAHYLLARARGDLTPACPALGFTVVDNGHDSPRVCWSGNAYDVSGADVLKAAAARARGLVVPDSPVVAFLRKQLGDGRPHLASLVVAAGEELGMIHKELWRGSRKLGVTRWRDGFQGPWLWSWRGAHGISDGIIGAQSPATDGIIGLKPSMIPNDSNDSNDSQSGSAAEGNGAVGTK